MAKLGGPGSDGASTPVRSGGKLNSRTPRPQPAPSGGVDVGFSDDRFLKRVLQEAQRSAGRNDAVQRLEGHGFSQEVAKIALHVSGGDERRALELCMSGLAFTGGIGDQGDLLSPEKICPPPAPLTCYICGGRHLTEKSLEMHTKACRKRFELREAKRPLGERRQLLEEAELPAGINSLEEYYELSGQRPRDRSAEGDRRQEKFQEVVAKQQRNETQLLPCDHCGRTFAADRLEKHRSVCLERPRQDPVPPPRKAPSSLRRKSADGGVGEKAYETFLQSLARCPGCTRPFRPELLEAHVKQCPAVAQAAEEQARATRGSQPSRFLGPRSKSQRRSLSGSGVPGSGDAPSPKAGAAAAASRRGAKAAAPAPLPVTSAAFAPPVRQNTRDKSPMQTRQGTRDKSPAQSRAIPKWASAPAPGGAATPTAPLPPPADEALQSSSGLLGRGFILPASTEVEAMLHAQLVGALPSANFVGGYEVARRPQHGVYEALRMSLQDQQADRGIADVELDLWHGTSWAIVGKILRDGFNRSFAGRHGTLLGVATYFSSDFSYSHRFCDRRGGGKDGTKVILLCGVLVGKYCKGSPSDIEPPVADPNTGERYDSTVDNEERPSIFAVFRDFQALPLYLVEFTT